MDNNLLNQSGGRQNDIRLHIVRKRNVFSSKAVNKIFSQLNIYFQTSITVIVLYWS